MSIIEILISLPVLGATTLFIILSICVEIYGNRLLNLVADVDATKWIYERTLVPFARAFALMIFMLIAYPTLFGLTQAPPIIDIIMAGPNRISTLINILFVIPLFFPYIPLIGKMPALLLPIQGIAGSTLIFSWMQAALQLEEIQYFPSRIVVVLIIIYAVVTHFLASSIAEPVSEKINEKLNADDAQKIVYRIIVVMAQLPAILIYTIGLGKQIT